MTTQPTLTRGRAPMGLEASTSCTLISASCTTGWFDWVHGELWLCADGLLRKSVGLIGTARHADARGGLRRTVPEVRPAHVFTSDEISSIVASDRRNRWIAWWEIEHATLKLGIIDHSLHLNLTDDRHAKFLWLKIDRGYDLLEDALSRSLGARFTAWRKPIG